MAVPLRVLYAHFDALPILIEYIKGLNHHKARRVLEKWDDARGNVGSAIDPSEAVFAFAAWMSSRENNILVGADASAKDIAELAMVFCKCNNLDMPSSQYGDRVNIPTAKQEEEVLKG